MCGRRSQVGRPRHPRHKGRLDAAVVPTGNVGGGIARDSHRAFPGGRRRLDSRRCIHAAQRPHGADAEPQPVVHGRGDGPRGQTRCDRRARSGGRAACAHRPRLVPSASGAPSLILLRARNRGYYVAITWEVHVTRYVGHVIGT
eukprot:scaffold74305_cov67-Phaeocystis_antarctica.AAC.2